MKFPASSDSSVPRENTTGALRQYPRTLLMVKSNAKDGLGGTLVRGELAYLDRSSLDWNFLQSMGLPTFGDPCANIYKEFLQRAEVDWIALDPKKGDAALRWMLGQVGAQILSNVSIESTIADNSILTGIEPPARRHLLGQTIHRCHRQRRTGAICRSAQNSKATKPSACQNRNSPSPFASKPKVVSIPQLKQVEYLLPQLASPTPAI